ncbi:hypothetical protein MMP66_00350 [Acinetobacter dispersus]|uniref:hypothetical protein n=1 Tax=Acinetobacter dispersus TaxID=70348 RepID=UPI001F4B8771|nr:hypothetical protein [Acinetobacter dispersus]MCH7389043.1 hypothetical protein [Acinetobacter dispersus]MCH7392727.1 hypothetical protein [Acinetobacter dispersus]
MKTITLQERNSRDQIKVKEVDNSKRQLSADGFIDRTIKSKWIYLDNQEDVAVEFHEILRNAQIGDRIGLEYNVVRIE